VSWGNRMALWRTMGVILLSGLLCAQELPVTRLAQPGASVFAASDTYLWKPVMVGGGGFITRQDFDNSGSVHIIRTDVYGAYLWSREQDRWLQLVTSDNIPRNDRKPGRFNQGAFEIAVAPNDASRIYMAIAGYIYRSIDGGRHFERPHEGPFPILFDANSEFRLYGPFMAVCPRDRNLAFAGTPHDGLLRTEDGGLSWKRVLSIPAGRAIRESGNTKSPGVLVWFERNSRNTIWALSYGNGMYISRDRGLHFVLLSHSNASQPTGLKQGVFASDGSFYGVDRESSSAWKYHDGKWTELGGHRGLIQEDFAAIAVSNDSRRVVISNQGGDLQISNDAGQSWKRLAHAEQVGVREPLWLRANSQSFFALAQLRFDPVLPDRLWVSAGTGPYYADLSDQPQSITWISQARGIEELVTNEVVQAPGQSPLFGAWDFGVRVKDNLDAYSDGYGPRERLLIAVQAMDWSAEYPSFVVTNASDTRMDCCSQDGNSILAGYSFDDGRQWFKFASLPTPPGTDPKDPWRMSFGAIAVSATNIQNIVWVPAFNRSPYFTLNMGQSWNRVVFPGERLPLTGSYADFTYHRKTIASDRKLPRTFYLYHSGDGANAALKGLWRSNDGGANWSRIFQGEISPLSSYNAKLRAVPGKAEHLFFTSGMPDADITKLMRSTDGGAHWTTVSKVDRVVDIGFGRAASEGAYPAIFIVGYVDGKYGIWRSYDDAVGWKRIGEFPLGSLDQIVSVEGDKDHLGRVYVGFQNSGWAYGEPAACPPRPYAFGAVHDCYSAGPPNLDKRAQ
jgi:photosystem II stability/assembly factor-like uncharacterized protein